MLGNDKYYKEKIKSRKVIECDYSDLRKPV